MSPGIGAGTSATRRPGAFRLNDPAVEAAGEPVSETLEPEASADTVAEADAVRAVDMIAHPRRRGVGWAAVALSAGGALLALWLTLTLASLVRGLFDWGGWLGWLG